MGHPFLERLATSPAQNKALCVGLDPDPSKIPAPYSDSLSGIRDFLRGVIAATQDIAVAYKPNISFFEALGIEGLHLLKELRNDHSDLIWIIDAKRGDIGNTSGMQAQFLFEHLGADAVTLHPYMGLDSLAPFFEYRDKFSFVLALTSNPGAQDFEMLALDSERSLYQQVTHRCQGWHRDYGNVGLVVGATHEEGLIHIRHQVPELLFLIPGVGAQGGDFHSTVSHGRNRDGLVLVNVGRSILYPRDVMSLGGGSAIFDAVRQAALTFGGSK